MDVDMELRSPIRGNRYMSSSPRQHGVQAGRDGCTALLRR